jgi:hypothetical protein
MERRHHPLAAALEDDIIREWRPGRSATIIHERRQQSDILIREQLQQGDGCTIDKEAAPSLVG